MGGTLRGGVGAVLCYQSGHGSYRASVSGTQIQMLFLFIPLRYLQIWRGNRYITHVSWTSQNTQRHDITVSDTKNREGTPRMLKEVPRFTRHISSSFYIQVCTIMPHNESAFTACFDKEKYNSKVTRSASK